MPIVIPASGFGRITQQTAKAGVTVTSGATAHTMGAWTTLVDPLSFDVFLLGIRVRNISVAAADRRYLLNVGVSPTGGGNEQIVIPFLDVGAASSVTSGLGDAWVFPLFIPAGKALRAQGQSSAASIGANVAVFAYGLPPHGFAEDAPQQWSQYGADSATSQGTAVTSGNGAFGTAVDVTGGAGTSAPHRWFHIGVDLSTNTVLTAGMYRVRLSRDSAGADVIGQWDFVISGNEDVNGPTPSFPVCVPVPAGSQLWVAIDGPAAEAMAAIVYAA